MYRTATDGIATVDLIIDRASNTRFSRLLMEVVALDDGWGLMLFSVGLAVATAISSQEATHPLVFVIHELGGAVLLGVVIGLPAAYLTGRIKPGQLMRSEALGLVFLCGGLALWAEVSFLVASMVMGMFIANLAKHHEFAFHEIEGLEWPVLSVFFVLAGASLYFVSLRLIGVAGFAYIALRIVGKVIGGYLGGGHRPLPPGDESLAWAGHAAPCWCGPVNGPGRGRVFS